MVDRVLPDAKNGVVYRLCLPFDSRRRIEYLDLVRCESIYHHLYSRLLEIEQECAHRGWLIRR